MALDAGFTNISIDLIIGLETQTARSMEREFPPHRDIQTRPIFRSISWKGSPARKRRPRRPALFSGPAGPSRPGLQHYEVSNYCLPGKASRHNLKYWRIRPISVSAHRPPAIWTEMDYRNFSDLKKYGTAIQSGKLPLLKTRPIDPAKRRIITGLRLLEGIPPRFSPPIFPHRLLAF